MSKWFPLFARSAAVKPARLRINVLAPTAEIHRSVATPHKREIKRGEIKRERKREVSQQTKKGSNAGHETKLGGEMEGCVSKF